MLRFLNETAKRLKNNHSRRFSARRATECCSAEILEPRQLLTATAIALDPTLQVHSVGVQDDGDRILAAWTSDDRGISGSAILTVDASGQITSELIGTLGEDGELATRGGLATYVTRISHNGEYFAGYGYTGDYYDTPTRRYSQIEGFLGNVANASDVTGTGRIGPSNWAMGHGVSDNGEVVGTTDGAGVAFYWSEQAGMVELTEPNGAFAWDISNTGVVVGQETTGINHSDATMWEGNTSMRLDTPGGHRSSATAISPNGRFIGGDTSYDDLTYFTVITQTVVWEDGSHIDISDANGDPIAGRVTAITDDGYTLITNGGSHLWHPSFDGTRELNEYLQTDHGLTFDNPLEWAYDMVHDVDRNELVILAGSHSHEDCTFNADIPGQPLCVTRTGQAQLITVSLDDMSDSVESGPIVTWESSDAASYEFWINDAESNTRVARYPGLTEPSVDLNDLPDGNYVYWVQDEDADGNGPWRSEQSLTIINGEIAIGSSPGTIEWDAATNPGTYEIWINDAATNELVHRMPRLTETSYSLPELNDGTYEYWIQDELADGSGPWRQKQQLTISNGQVVASASVGRLAWAIDPQAATYEIWINDASTNEMVHRAAGLTETQAELPHLADGEYYYWIQHETESGDGDWTDHQSFRVENGQRVEGPTSVGSITWDSAVHAVSYEIWINDSDSNALAFREAGVNGTSFTFPHLVDGEYKYWIQSETEDGDGAWSEATTFTVYDGQIVAQEEEELSAIDNVMGSFASSELF